MTTKLFYYTKYNQYGLAPPQFIKVMWHLYKRLVDTTIDPTELYGPDGKRLPALYQPPPPKKQRKTAKAKKSGAKSSTKKSRLIDQKIGGRVSLRTRGYTVADTDLNVADIDLTVDNIDLTVDDIDLTVDDAPTSRNRKRKRDHEDDVDAPAMQRAKKDTAEREDEEEEEEEWEEEEQDLTLSNDGEETFESTAGRANEESIQEVGDTAEDDTVDITEDGNDDCEEDIIMEPLSANEAAFKNVNELLSEKEKEILEFQDKDTQLHIELRRISDAISKNNDETKKKRKEESALRDQREKIQLRVQKEREEAARKRAAEATSKKNEKTTKRVEEAINAAILAVEEQPELRSMEDAGRMLEAMEDGGAQATPTVTANATTVKMEEGRVEAQENNQPADSPPGFSSISGAVDASPIMNGAPAQISVLPDQDQSEGNELCDMCDSFPLRAWAMQDDLKNAVFLGNSEQEGREGVNVASFHRINVTTEDMPGNLFALSSIYKKEGEDDEFMPWIVDGGESYWPQWRLVKEDGSQYGERFALILRKINQEEDHLKSVDVSWVSGPPRSFRILQKKSIEAPTGAKLCYAEELEELTDHNYNLASSQAFMHTETRRR
uniref:Uncharacterized protein n=1 Tax=Pristionchus pacificus TaxID=54126 RepID=A0A8R1YUS2_PRIPA